jgi:ATP-dependent helicase/nuclease subunit B
MHLYTISASNPFLTTLAGGVAARYADAPEKLASCWVILPTQRAAAAFRQAYLAVSAQQACILPKIFSFAGLAEISDSFSLFSPAPNLPLPSYVLNQQELILLLTQTLIDHCADAIPTLHFVSAHRLASEIAALLSECDREAIDPYHYAALLAPTMADASPAMQAILTVIATLWPQKLHALHALTPIQYRNQIIQTLVHYLQSGACTHRVIIAGATGNLPATATLMRATLEHPEGMVVLPGYEPDYSTLLDPTHPQAAMQQWVSSLPSSVAVRYWQGNFRDAAPPKIELLEASSLHEEAAAIALTLRETLENPHTTAALITNDRTLALQVQAQLQRYGIRVDDSSGIPLSATPTLIFLRLWLKMALHPNLIDLLALLKDPLCCQLLAVFHPEHSNHVKTLETHYIQNMGYQITLHEIAATLPEASPIAAWFAAIANSLYRFADCLYSKSPAPLSTILLQHLTTMAALSTPEEVFEHPILWSLEGGEHARDLFHHWVHHSPLIGSIHPADYATVFESSVATERYRPHSGLHPRLAILSPHEGSLLHFDSVILGGLNAGSWPSKASGHFFGPALRQQLGLKSEKHAMGLAHFEFMQFLHCPHILLTRACKHVGGPTIASPFLSRLQLQRRAEDRFLPPPPSAEWATLLYRNQAIERCKAPMPTPPLAARPVSFRITQIERWLGNPYEFYAMAILALSPLPPLALPFNRVRFGIWLHHVCERATKQLYASSTALHSQEEIFALYETIALNSLPVHDKERPTAQALWWPRCQKIFTWLAAYDYEQRRNRTLALAEQSGLYQWQEDGTEFTLVGKADRIEIAPAGEVRILDYKTGAIPSQIAVRQGHAPQLPLLMLLGASGTLLPNPAEITGLGYLELTGKEQGGAAHLQNCDLNTLLDEALTGLKTLVKSYHQPDAPYPAFFKPEGRLSRYDHLARTKEWAS